VSGNPSSVILPPFSILGPDNDPPHRNTVIARKTIANQYGTDVLFEVRTNRKEDTWWIAALYPGKNGESSFRASGTLRTTSAAKAQQWIEAVNAGAVAVEERI
jgi:hypothetical protein